MNKNFIFPRVKKAQPLQARNKTIASALSAMQDDDDQCVIEIDAVVANDFGK